MSRVSGISYSAALDGNPQGRSNVLEQILTDIFFASPCPSTWVGPSGVENFELISEVLPKGCWWSTHSWYLTV